MSKKTESAEEREARIAHLKHLYDSGRIDEVLIPENADVSELVADIKSGRSEAERKLFELLRKTRKR